MTTEHSLGKPADLAALSIAGAMTDQEAVEFARHLADGCQQCAAELEALTGVFASLASAVAPIAPRAEVRDRLLARLDAEDKAPQTAAHASNGKVVADQKKPNANELYVQRAAEGQWFPVPQQPGIHARVLYRDRERKQVTVLLRMEPGASYPPHCHDQPEECLVLEGELRVGDLVLRAGDFQRAPAGLQQSINWTESGCLLLATSPLD